MGRPTAEGQLPLTPVCGRPPGVLRVASRTGRVPRPGHRGRGPSRGKRVLGKQPQGVALFAAGGRAAPDRGSPWAVWPRSVRTRKSSRSSSAAAAVAMVSALPRRRRRQCSRIRIRLFPSRRDGVDGTVLSVGRGTGVAGCSGPSPGVGHGRGGGGAAERRVADRRGARGPRRVGHGCGPRTRYGTARKCVVNRPSSSWTWNASIGGSV